VHLTWLRAIRPAASHAAQKTLRITSRYCEIRLEKFGFVGQHSEKRKIVLLL